MKFVNDDDDDEWMAMGNTSFLQWSRWAGKDVPMLNTETSFSVYAAQLVIVWPAQWASCGVCWC